MTLVSRIRALLAVRLNRTAVYSNIAGGVVVALLGLIAVQALAGLGYAIHIRVDSVNEFNATIDFPPPGYTVTEDAFDNMQGRLEGPLPSDRKLIVLIADRHRYFVMQPNARVDKKRWSQTNVRMGTDGTWTLWLCLSRQDAGALQPQFEEIPPNLDCLTNVTVVKRQQP